MRWSATRALINSPDERARGRKSAAEKNLVEPTVAMRRCTPNDGKTTMRSLQTPVLTLALLCGTLWLWFTQIDGSSWELHHTIGVALIAPSWLLWARARYDLGASFTGRAEARALITRGIYARIRHPIYVFGLVVRVGLFVFLGRPLLLLILIVTEPVQFIRARREERVLEAAFGEKYRAYKAGTWF